MPKFIYLTIASVDGYMEDAGGKFDWATPSDDAHAFINDLMRPVGTYFYGRRMYETMSYWEPFTEGEPVHLDFADIWRAADKVVFSRTLEAVSTARTCLEREFRPDVVKHALRQTGRDAAIGGANIAASAFAAQLVDEFHLLIAPHVAGGGRRALPEGMTLSLELRDERRFGGGMVYLRYAVRHS